MHEYLFDVKLFASIRFRADSEEQARAMMRERGSHMMRDLSLVALALFIFCLAARVMIERQCSDRKTWRFTVIRGGCGRADARATFSEAKARVLMLLNTKEA